MVILGPTENHNIKALRSDIDIIRTSSVFLSLLVHASGLYMLNYYYYYYYFDKVLPALVNFCYAFLATQLAALGLRGMQQANQ